MNKPETIEKEAEKFDSWLQEQQGLAKTSASMYSSYIKRLPYPLDFKEQDSDEIKPIIEDAITTAPVKSAFQKYFQYLNQTRGYGKEASMELNWIRDQMKDFSVSEGSKLDKSEVLDKYLESSKIQTLIQYMDNRVDRSWFKSEKEFDQFRILPLLMFETGARVSEMIGKQQDPDHDGLMVSDIDFTENKITIRDAKYGKNRTADFDLAADMLKSYLQKHGIEKGRVFDIDYSRFLRKLKKVSGKALNQSVTTHAFRHSFATNWVIERNKEGESWADAKEKVNEYLDHNDMKTTEAYINAAQELVRKNIYDEYGSFSIDVEMEV